MVKEAKRILISRGLWRVKIDEKSNWHSSKMFSSCIFLSTIIFYCLNFIISRSFLGLSMATSKKTITTNLKKWPNKAKFSPMRSHWLSFLLWLLLLLSISKRLSFGPSCQIGSHQKFLVGAYPATPSVASYRTQRSKAKLSPVYPSIQYYKLFCLAFYADNSSRYTH